MKNKTELLNNIINACADFLSKQLNEKVALDLDSIINFLLENILLNCPMEDLKNTKQIIDSIYEALEVLWPSIIDNTKSNNDPVQYFIQQVTPVVLQKLGISIEAIQKPTPVNPANTPTFKTSSINSNQTTPVMTLGHTEHTNLVYLTNAPRIVSIKQFKEQTKLSFEKILSKLHLNVKDLLSYNYLENNDAPSKATEGDLRHYLLKKMGTEININDLDVPLSEEIYQELFPELPTAPVVLSLAVPQKSMQKLKDVLKESNCTLDKLFQMTNMSVEHVLVQNGWSEEQIIIFITEYTNALTSNEYTSLTIEEFLTLHGHLDELLIDVSALSTLWKNSSVKNQDTMDADIFDCPFDDSTPATPKTAQPKTSRPSIHLEEMLSLQNILREQNTTVDDILNNNHLTIEDLLTQNHWSEKQIDEFTEQHLCAFSLEENLTYDAFIKAQGYLEKLMIKSSVLNRCKSLENHTSTNIVSYPVRELQKILKKEFNEILALFELELDVILSHNKITPPEHIDDKAYGDFKSLSAESQLLYLYEIEPNDCMIPVPISLISSLSPTTITCRPLTKADAPYISGEYFYSFIALASSSNNQTQQPCGVLIGASDAKKFDDVTTLNVLLYITDPNYQLWRIEIFTQLLQELFALKEGLPNLQQIIWSVTEKTNKITSFCGFISNKTLAHGKRTIQLTTSPLSEEKMLKIIQGNQTQPPSSAAPGFFDTRSLSVSKESKENTECNPSVGHK